MGTDGIAMAGGDALLCLERNDGVRAGTGVLNYFARRFLNMRGEACACEGGYREQQALQT